MGAPCDDHRTSQGFRPFRDVIRWFCVELEVSCHSYFVFVSTQCLNSFFIYFFLHAEHVHPPYHLLNKESYLLVSLKGAVRYPPVKDKDGNSLSPQYPQGIGP